MKRPLTPSEMYPAGVADIRTRFVQLSTGVTVRVAERGPPDGKPVIMLHGWGACLYMWRHAFQLLPAYGVRAIGIDLRGYGLSDKPVQRGAYTLDAYCADIDALYDALGIEQAGLIGHSMGGAIALHYALRNPGRVRALGLVNPADIVPLIYPTLLRATPRAMTRLVRKSFVSRSLIALILRRLAYGDASLVTDHDVDEYWAPTRQPGFVFAAGAALHEFDWRPLTPAQSSTLVPPTAVILGRDDRLIRKAHERAAQLGNSTVYELRGGHSVHEELPGEVYAILGELVR